VLYFVLNGGKQMQPEEAVDKPALKDSQLFQSGTSTVEGETPALIELNGINPQNDNSKKKLSVLRNNQPTTLTPHFFQR
jgi:hypothetical protein